MSSQDGEILQLPEDLHENYLLELDPRSLQNACRSCRTYADVCKESNIYFWKTKFIKDLPGRTKFEDLSWKKSWIVYMSGSVTLDNSFNGHIESEEYAPDELYRITLSNEQEIFIKNNIGLFVSDFINNYPHNIPFLEEQVAHGTGLSGGINDNKEFIVPGFYEYNVTSENLEVTLYSYIFLSKENKENLIFDLEAYINNRLLDNMHNSFDMTYEGDDTGTVTIYI